MLLFIRRLIVDYKVLPSSVDLRWAIAQTSMMHGYLHYSTYLVQPLSPSSCGVYPRPDLLVLLFLASLMGLLQPGLVVYGPG
jgi:hypothetical protein